ncbi:hypothetical protein PMAYCL1PPCAC_20452, partial [Pristionchus mayeri]
SPSTTIPDLSTSPLPSTNNDRIDPKRTATPEANKKRYTVGKQSFFNSLTIQEQLTKLPSGLTVASAKHNGPTDLVHLALTYRAGARYDTSPSQKGLAFMV